MTSKEYNSIKSRLIELGYSDEIKWAEDIKPVKNAWDFASEYAWVVINSGMKNQIARKIWNDIQEALWANDCVSLYFGHKGKREAIKRVWDTKHIVFKKYQRVNNKLSFLESLPFIGPITKYHLAKNLGIDCCKPDRHLTRIAEKHKTTPQELCANLAKKTGDSIALVDLVLWRAANLRLPEVK